MAPNTAILESASGGLEILVGFSAFANTKTMIAAVTKQIKAAKKASLQKGTKLKTTVLSDPAAQKDAIAFNSAKVQDLPSVRIVQTRVGSDTTGKWDAATVRHIAERQQGWGRNPDGKVDEATLEALVNDLVAADDQDAALHLIIDWYGMDRSHAFSVYFETDTSMLPPGKKDVNAWTTSVHGAGTGGVVRVYPGAFTRSFAGLVHTVAHELGHIQQVIGGITSEAVREFLSESIEIESKGMPEEPVGSVADIIDIQAGQRSRGGFLDPAANALTWWQRMTPQEKAANHHRFSQIRQIVFDRINQAPLPARVVKAALLWKFLEAWRTADHGVP